MVTTNLHSGLHPQLFQRIKLEHDDSTELITDGAREATTAESARRRERLQRRGRSRGASEHRERRVSTEVSMHAPREQLTVRHHMHVRCRCSCEERMCRVREQNLSLCGKIQMLD